MAGSRYHRQIVGLRGDSWGCPALIFSPAPHPSAGKSSGMSLLEISPAPRPQDTMVYRDAPSLRLFLVDEETTQEVADGRQAKNEQEDDHDQPNVGLGDPLLYNVDIVQRRQ